MPILKQIPHEAKDPVIRFHQLLSNGYSKEAKEYLAISETEKSSALKQSLEKLTSILPSNWPPIKSQDELDIYEEKLRYQLKFLLLLLCF